MQRRSGRLAQQPHLKSKIVSDTSDEGMLDGHAIAISPADPDAVIVAVRMGLFRTARRWRNVAGHGGRPVLADDLWPRHQGVAAEPNTLYSALSVAAASKDGAVYRSQDKGKTWQRFDKVQVHGTIMSVALHQNDPKQVYIGARYDGEVFGTLDGGADLAVDEPAAGREGYLFARLRLITLRPCHWRSVATKQSRSECSL